MSNNYDPATRAKIEQFQAVGSPVTASSASVSNPISAQPVTYAVGTVAAAPAYHSQAYVHPANLNNNQPVRQYPRGRWADSICDWPRNLVSNRSHALFL